MPGGRVLELVIVALAGGIICGLRGGIGSCKWDGARRWLPCIKSYSVTLGGNRRAGLGSSIRSADRD